VIKRLDFKIGEGDWADTSMVANDVQVKFKLQLNGVALP
jgi:polyisoprenoid-binding protein YceI